MIFGYAAVADDVDLSQTYGGLRVALVGGRPRTRFPEHLSQLGFDAVDHIPVTAKRARRMYKAIRRSDLGLVLTSRCSHELSNMAKSACADVQIPCILLPGHDSPQMVNAYLLAEYQSIMPKIILSRIERSALNDS